MAEVLAQDSDGQDGRRTHRREADETYRRGVLYVLAAFALFKLIFFFILPITGDEALIWEWSRHLDWCYVDHPPLTAWLVRLSTTIFGANAFAVRLPGLVLGLLTILTLVRLSRVLFGSEGTAFWTAVVLACLPILHATSLLTIVDASLFLFWSLGALWFVRAIESERLADWLIVGLCLGLATLAKLTGWLFAVAALAALLAHPNLRRHLRTPGPYLAVLLGLAMFTPVLYWNATHDWANFRFTLANKADGPEGSVNFLWYLLDQTTPVFILIWLASAGAFVTWARQGFANLPAKVSAVWWLSATPVLLFAVLSFRSRVALHWPAAGLILAVVLMVPVLIESPRRWVRRFFGVAWAGALTLVAVFHVAILFLHEIALRQDVSRDITTSELKAIFGWKEIGQRVNFVREEMSLQGPVFLITPNHVFAAQFAFYAPGHPFVQRFGKPSVYGRNYELWQRYAEQKGHDAVYFHDGEIKGGRLERLQEAFERVELEKPMAVVVRGKTVRYWYLARCYGFRSYPWQEYLDDVMKL